MGADGLHLAVLEEDDLIQSLHRRDAVRDEQSGLACTALFQVVEDDFFRPGIHRRNRIVEDQDGRIFQQGAGDGDALLLTARDGDTALAQDSLVAILEVHNVVPDVSKAGRPFNVLGGGVIHAKGDVVGDGIREEEVLLRDIGTRLPHRVDGDAVDVLPIHEKGAVGDVISAQEQIDQRRLACAGLAHDAHALAGLDREGDVFQHIELAVRVAEGQIAELNAALGVFEVRHTGAVGHINGRVQQLGDAVEGGFAAGGLFDEHRDRHDGPDDRLEIADVLHQLARIEIALVDKIAAVAEDDADDRLHEERHHYFEQYRDAGILHVDFFVVFVEFAESDEFFELLDKRLDDRDAGEVLLRKVGQVRERPLALLPRFGHGLAHHGADGKHERCRDEGQHGHASVHAPHPIEGQQTQHQCVKEHQDAVAEALLDGVEVVGVEAHEVADLVHLIVLLGQTAAVVEHLLPQSRLHPDAGAEEADAPQKAPHHHEQHDPYHGQADVLEQHLFRERHRLAPHHHLSEVDAVDDQTIELRHKQLDIVHHQQRKDAQQQRGRVAQVIAVDVLAEYHWFSLPFP